MGSVSGAKPHDGPGAHLLVSGEGDILGNKVISGAIK